MIDAKVYLIRTDVETTAHCGHRIHVGEKYVMLRTLAPRWVSLCESCVALIASPIEVDMKTVVHEFEKRMPNETERKRKISVLKKVERKRREVEVLSDAEWV